jgi:lysozyme
MFSGLGRPLTPVSNSPKLHQPVLAIGADDAVPPGGDDVLNMQSRLRDLRYYSGNLDGIFGTQTDRAVRDFQTDYFGAAEADGKVGEETWDKLWGDASPIQPNPGPGPGVPGPGPGPAPGKDFLMLTRTNKKDQYGLADLTLAYFKDGVSVSKLDVCSGEPTKQVFLKGVDSQRGSGQPLPEGKWHINDLEWADGKDNYSGGIFNLGLGPAKLHLDYIGPGTTDRADIDMHIDWNRKMGGPGTAGCVGLYDIEDFKTFVTWLRDTNPQFLYVDWGLGSCPAPSATG